MSKNHPVVVVTGSSGAGTSTVRKALESIFHRHRIKPASIEGDSLHRYDRNEMHEQMMLAQERGERLSHFGAEANQFELLEQLFREYGESGSGPDRTFPPRSRNRRRGRPSSGAGTPPSSWLPCRYSVVSVSMPDHEVGTPPDRLAT